MKKMTRLPIESRRASILLLLSKFIEQKYIKNKIKVMKMTV